MVEPQDAMDEGPEPRPMSQNEIDELFAELGSGSRTALPPVGMDEADILAALAEAGVTAEEPGPVLAAAAAPDSGPVDEVPVDEDQAGEPAGAEDEDIEDALQGAISQSDSALTQGDIDALLAGLDGDGGEEPAVDTDTVAGQGPATISLTAEKLAEVLARQEQTPAVEETGTGLISQDDVDALLAQMQTASGDTPAPVREQEPDQSRSEVDDLLDSAAARGPRDDLLLTSQVAAPPPAAPQAAYLSPDELRGGRYLLIAAVGLLGVCAVTLLLVVSSVNRLTSELRAERDVREAPGDDFDEAMAVARSYLAESDPDQVQRGVDYIMRMKDRYGAEPEREDTVTLLLARHYRQRGAWQSALVEYQAIDRRNDRLLDDPSIYLEYAECLMERGRMVAAEAAIYELIANAAWYRSGELPDGRRRDAEELASNERILRRAHILLGRLYRAPVLAVGERSGA